MHRIAQLRDRFSELHAHGLDVLVVLCQRRKSVTSWAAKHPLPFPILIDKDRSRAKLWGVYSLIRYDGIHIARPASFVVDASGVIRYARVSRHQLDQAPLAEILET